MYQRSNLLISQIRSCDSEILCAEISHQKHNCKKYIISKIYRKPGEILDKFNVFLAEFTSFLTYIKIKIVLHTCVETITSIY